jgi:hypothetical protein
MITARDYNLTISMSWRAAEPAGQQAVADAKLFLMLANVCRSSLLVLRVS